MNNSKRYLIGGLVFVLVLISMCYLKLWYTLFIIFLFAIIQTLVTKKRGFCYSMCPLGTAMDFGDSKKMKAKKLKYGILAKKIWFSIFWIYSVVFVVFLYNRPMELWRQMLFIMFFSFAAAIILQEKYGKRYWCINMCPLGSILDMELKGIRKNKGNSVK